MKYRSPWFLCSFVALALPLLVASATTVSAAIPNGADGDPVGKIVFVDNAGRSLGEAGAIAGVSDFVGTGVLSPDYGYNGVHWANPAAIRYRVNPANSGVNSATTVGAVKASLITWDYACGPLKFSYRGTTTLTGGVRDYANVVSWGDLSSYPGAIAVTTIWYKTASKAIVEVDTVMNVAFLWSYTKPDTIHDLSSPAAEDISRYSDPTNSGTAGKFDIRDIMTHEAGHWIMLGDLYNSSDSELTMYGYGTTAEIKKDTLAYGDELGVEAVYGA